jgi:hypothetical protein
MGELGLQNEITEGVHPHRDEHHCYTSAVDGVKYRRRLQKTGLGP